MVEALVEKRPALGSFCISARDANEKFLARMTSDEDRLWSRVDSLISKEPVSPQARNEIIAKVDAIADEGDAIVARWERSPVRQELLEWVIETRLFF